MRFRPFLWLSASLAVLPFALAQEAQQEPTCEQVFKNIDVFKGVPARDLIPSMEFMAASLKYSCTDCHDAKDYSVDTAAKRTSRKMVTMQREINKQFFNGRLEVTCMSCHNGREHPLAAPLPADVPIRHPRPTAMPDIQDIFKEHIHAAGVPPTVLTLKGTLTAPSEEKGKPPTTTPLELIQAADGRFRVNSELGNFGFDGKQVWRAGMALTDEPAAIFARIGRAWRGDKAFEGFSRASVVGSEKLGKFSTTVVRGSRDGTGSTEELYFDDKGSMIIRFVSMTRSSLGTVISVYDYSNFKNVGAKVPMTVSITFAGGENWLMQFKSATASYKVDDSLFTISK